MTKKLFLPPATTVDVVIFTIEGNDLKILLIRRENEPFRRQWALPGGFLFKNETAEQASYRVLHKKAGARVSYLEQLYTFDSPFRDPRGHVLTIAYMALVSRKNLNFTKRKELQNPTFYSVKKIPKLAFDHRNILVYAIKRLRAKLEYTNVVLSLLPKLFTFNQLQKTYEIILNRKLDKRNFRKKFMLLKLIRPTLKILKGERQRPARLYQFISRKSAELKKFF